MEENLEKIKVLEKRIKDLEARVKFLTDTDPNTDIKEHIKRLKERKSKLEKE